MRPYVTTRDNLYNIPERYPFLVQFIQYTETGLMFFSSIRINEYLERNAAKTNNHVTYGLLNKLLLEGKKRGDWNGNYVSEFVLN